MRWFLKGGKKKFVSIFKMTFCFLIIKNNDKSFQSPQTS